MERQWTYFMYCVLPQRGWGWFTETKKLWLLYLSFMVSLQEVTTMTPAAVAREAWMAETSLNTQNQHKRPNMLLCCLSAPTDTSLNASSTRRSTLVSSADMIHKCDGVFFFFILVAMCATLEQHFTKSSLWFIIRKPNLAALHMNR